MTQRVHVPGVEFLLLYAAVVVGPAIARLARLPDLVGLLVAGMLLGPNVIGVMSQEGLAGPVAHVGLLLLMFQAGTDLDLSRFALRRTEAVRFGIASTVLPLLAVGAVALAVDMTLPAAAIIASAFASHTLLSYPQVVGAGLVTDRSVVASLGATLLVTVLSLSVLAVGAASTETGIANWLWFGAGAAGFAATAVYLAPPAVRWLLTVVGAQRYRRVPLLMGVMLAMALLGDLLGIEQIIGAFVAGLVVNRFVPDGSPVSLQLRSLADNLFVPAFLVVTGMLLDPTALARPRVVALAAALALATIASKGMAAGVVGLTSGWSLAQGVLGWSLTAGQAAGTLAATVVAVNLNLVTDEHVSAVILALAACALFAGASAAWAVRHIDPGDDVQVAGERVMVPVARLDTADRLISTACLAAAADGGTVLAVQILPPDTPPARVGAARRTLVQVENRALRAGVEADVDVRIGDNIADALYAAAVERHATLMLLGWPVDPAARRFGAPVDQLLRTAPCPVGVLAASPTPSDHVVMVLDRMRPTAASDAALDIAIRMARGSQIPLTVIAPARPDSVPAHVNVEINADPISRVEQMQASTLIVTDGWARTRESLERLRLAPASSLVIWPPRA